LQARYACEVAIAKKWVSWIATAWLISAIAWAVIPFWWQMRPLRCSASKLRDRRQYPAVDCFGRALTPGLMMDDRVLNRSGARCVGRGRWHGPSDPLGAPKHSRELAEQAFHDGGFG
jgi:hypothetical protein